jgi:Co/Zn/Cd efflux system component
MIEPSSDAPSPFHSHVFLGAEHETSERKTWAVIWLCGAMMIAEIVGGLLFGSIALIADGLHMSTHAGALLLAALADTYARKHANDPNYTFGTGKLGDLAGFTSAIILAMIALLIDYESVSRIFAPVAIHFAEAIPIACVGLAVNIASAWLLSGGVHHHGHGHGHAHGDHEHNETHRITIKGAVIALEVFEQGVPPRFRLRVETGPAITAQSTSIETVRPDGARKRFTLQDRDDYLESIEEIPEPHAFTAHLRVGGQDYPERLPGGACAHRKSAAFSRSTPASDLSVPTPNMAYEPPLDRAPIAIWTSPDCYRMASGEFRLNAIAREPCHETSADRRLPMR